MSIVVTAATGHLGTEAVHALLRRGVDPAHIVAGGRDRERLAKLAAHGVRTTRIDLDEPGTLAAAFAGADKVLFVSVPGSDRRVAQHRRVVEAAAAAGVRLLAYTSWCRADISTIHADHRATEQMLREIGVPWVVLRNPAYFEFRTSWIPVWRAAGRVVGAAGDGRTSGAARADLAAAAATVLTTEGHEGTIYEVGGDEPYTMAEFAAELSRQTDETIPYVDLSVPDFRAHLVAAGHHEAVATHLAATDRAIADGELCNATGALRTLVGRPLVTLRDAIAAALHTTTEAPVLPPVRTPHEPHPLTVTAPERTPAT
jgi:NAD(P)H dehydrogenase (quinone)